MQAVDASSSEDVIVNVKTFTAASPRQALQQIKAALGDDAVVLSSCDLPAGGVQFTAVKAAELDRIGAAAEPAAPPPPPAWPAAPGAVPAPERRHHGAPGAARQGTVPAAPAKPAKSAAPTPPTPPTPPARPANPYAAAAAAAAAAGGPGAAAAPAPALAASVRLPEPAPSSAPWGGAAAPPRAAAPAALPSASPPAAAARATPAAAAPAAEPVAAPQIDQLSVQLAEVKSLLAGHLAQGYWQALQARHPLVAHLVQRLLSAGLSSKVVTELVDAMPPAGTMDEVLRAAQGWIQRRLTVRDPFDMFDRGGVYAFMGPTGVGKTTTVAKIAARCVLRYGRGQVALLTTDIFRIGAQEQLRVFGRILNLPVTPLRDSDELRARLTELRGRKVVLLDTAGVSQRDLMMLDQVEMIERGCAEVHRVLVMSSTTSTRTLDDVIEAHHEAATDQGIAATVITKLDEAMSLGPPVDCILRHRLPVLFLCNGQRVPEDLFPADPAYLAHRAVHPRGGGAVDTEPGHLPALLADDLSAWSPDRRA
jgi:flagellar biosynthesis protein FlhF